jgi:hypothetical protein
MSLCSRRFVWPLAVVAAVLCVVAPAEAKKHAHAYVAPPPPPPAEVCLDAGAGSPGNYFPSGWHACKPNERAYVKMPNYGEVR